MKTYRFADLTKEELRQLCERNPVEDAAIMATCQEIFEQVALRDDEAVREFTRRFDGVDLEDFRVDARLLPQAVEDLDPDLLEALKVAIRNIRTFHASQQLAEKPVAVQPGVSCWRAARAISTVGLYVPGGTAVLPSTVLMLAIPAKLAGCSKIVLCVPPLKDGTVSPLVLAAAHLVGIRHIFKIGGAQAIAAMALGTGTVPKVSKILGPGNRIVQTAKLLATMRGVAIDMVAGPSEVLVIADQEASANVVASDLISQAEHGVDSQVVLVSNSPAKITEVEEALQRQLMDLPRRDIAEKALAQSYSVAVNSLDEAFEFSNLYAPEHLILNIDSPRDWLGKVKCAGSVFVGALSPEVAGDYASGTNHTLPTSGMARNVSGVSLDTFVNKITFQELTAEGLRGLAPTLKALAEAESLEGHARAVTCRLDELEEEEQ